MEAGLHDFPILFGKGRIFIFNPATIRILFFPTGRKFNVVSFSRNLHNLRKEIVKMKDMIQLRKSYMKNIVIVDDSAIFQKIMENILRPHFKIVAKGFSGTEAIELYKKFEPDLLLLDITMPDCDGKECLQKIVSINPKAKIIMVSGLADPATIAECLALGAKAFITKSQISTTNVKESELLKAINTVLGIDKEKLEAA